MARNWTEKQTDAIRARNGSVLVSAAAGSGKTAVLVERVIERITDANNPSSVSRLLIVTFTKAAANEMRQRISEAIEACLKEKPGDSNLINQQMLLPSAKICTIDSFCGWLVRDNFQLIDISPDFRIADDGELSLLKNQAMDMTLDELYAEENRDFLNLVELLFKGRDDKNLEDMIYKLYDTSMSYPFPEKWLDEVALAFENCESIAESAYGKIIFAHLKDALSFCMNQISMMKAQMHGWDEIEKAYGNVVDSYESQVGVMLGRVNEQSWDAAKSAIESFDGGRIGRVPKDMKELFEVKMLGETKDMIKKLIKEKLAPLMCCTEQEFVSDMNYLEPMVHQLCRAAKLFLKNYAEVKQEKELADFNDVSHMALSLLVKPTENGFERTSLADELSECFDEILIDEYQDTNKAQDMLFTSIANNNLFRVGDVKQSIYRFRRAMPEIFIDLKNSYDEYCRDKDNYPAKIVLGNNFRSRQSVTGAVNFIFSQMMSKQVGDIDYNAEEELVFSAAYPEVQESAEFHLLETKEMDSDSENNHSFQARYIADLIDNMIKSGFTVKDGNTMRKAAYKDFCVLMRGVNGGKGAAYAEQFRLKNIPCFTEIAVDFFSAYEVSLVLSLLRVIDNPKQDIPLLTVMMSAIFGFTVDDMARLRINDRESDIYG
ncbi:MAG: UvrD-helicase domain-containing protein, partial [Ruminococcus sp.]|nr:UvrD-helicase domain-containing protein [Ruminococcus sp.]